MMTPGPGRALFFEASGTGARLRKCVMRALSQQDLWAMAASRWHSGAVPDLFLVTHYGFVL